MFEKKNQRHLQLEFRPYAYQQEIPDNLEAEREVYGHYNNLLILRSLRLRSTPYKLRGC